MDARSEKELIKQLRNNNQKALEELYAQYYYRLCNFAFQYVRSFDLTEEIVSDVFLSIWKRRDRLKIRKSFKAYLYTATRNKALNYIKKEAGHWESIDEMDEQEMTSLNYNPEEELLFKEFKTQIDVLISVLPPRRKLIFKLSRLEGFTYREIAEIMSISIHTVQNQMVAAIKQMSSMHLVDK